MSNKYVWSPGDVTWSDEDGGPTDARALKLIELEVGLAVIKTETGGHVPPRFAKPRDPRQRFRSPVGRAGEHGGFSPGEHGHEPLRVGSEHSTTDVDMDEVSDRRHIAPGEDGHRPNSAGQGIPASQDDPHTSGKQVIEEEIRQHEAGRDVGAGNLPKALTPSGVTKDFPAWKFDRELASMYARRLGNLSRSVDLLTLADAWLSANKAEGGQPPPPQGGDPAPWLAQALQQWSDALAETMNSLWTEAYFLGHKAGEAIAAVRTVDWGNWKPGHPEAASKVTDEASFRRWLEHYGIASIKSIRDSRMGLVADVLHTSLDEGWSPDQLARKIRDLLDAPFRARMIAVTETARAVSQGTLDAYRQAEVERVQWLTSDDARVCPPCDANEAMGAIPTGAVFASGDDAPPAHPHCRCVVVAVPDFLEVPPRAVAVTKFDAGKIHDKLAEHYPGRVLNWVIDAKWSAPEKIPLKDIDMARRPGGRNMKKVRRMAKAIKNGKRIDPIFLVETPDGGPLAIADGYHRALAHQHAGESHILAHVGTVDVDEGPWDREMHDAKLNKVGPKGYIHGWIYVGPQEVGGRVFHHQHGKGTVTRHEVEPGKKVRGSVHVQYDNGHTEQYRARFKETSKPRVYGPVDLDAKPIEPEQPKRQLVQQGLRVHEPGEGGKRVGLVIPHPDGYWEAQHDERGAYGRFATEDEALDEVERAWNAKKVTEQQHEHARQALRQHHARQRDKAVHVALGANLTDAQREKIIAKRKRVMDLYGDNLRLHDEVTSKQMRQHLGQFFSLPEGHHKVIAARGYQIDMGHGSVADYQTHLKGIKPGGYAEGTTWADSAGAHNSADRWLVFGNTVKHGSHNMVAHEMGHALDASIQDPDGDYPHFASADHTSPWGPGFMVYFDGLTDYDRGRSMTDSEYIRIWPYYRPEQHGGHYNGNKEMFAEAYSAYVSNRNRSREVQAEAISRTLKGGIFDGDSHVGNIMADYFDDLTEWLEKSK